MSKEVGPASWVQGDRKDLMKRIVASIGMVALCGHACKAFTDKPALLGVLPSSRRLM